MQEEMGRKKKLEVKDFLLMQMGKVSSTKTGQPTDSSGFINMPTIFWDLTLKTLPETCFSTKKRPFALEPIPFT